MEDQKEVFIEKRKEEARRLEEFLSNFEDRRAGLAAAALGISVEDAHRVGYR